MEQVQVRVSERGALRNGRFAFTNKYTLVSELLQNARRAGASRVDLRHDAGTRTLSVSDDGRGVDDFQKLLTFNESGWDSPMAEVEKAFGIGFSKALYAAECVTVTSNGRRLAFATRDALDQVPLQLEKCDASGPLSTSVHLRGVDLPDLDERIGRIVCGFPLPVTFNDEDIPRPYAIDTLPTTATEVGEVHLHGCQSGQRAAGRLVFLQGFLVDTPDWWWPGEALDVVHLDSRQFLARLPDRTQLIDAEEQSARIGRSLRELWRRVLLRRKQQLPAAVFLDRFFGVAVEQGHSDLLDDLPLLPAQVGRAIIGYPVQEGYGHRSYLEPLREHLERRAVESGNVLLARLSLPDGANLAYWMYARSRGYVVLRSHFLNEDHWVHRHVRALEEEPVDVEIFGEQHRFEFQGHFVSAEVVLCDRYALTVGGDRMEITTDPLFHANRIIVPRDGVLGEVVRQASAYLDADERFCETEMEADRMAFCLRMRRLRSNDPVATLASLIAGLGLETYPLLAGKRFRVEVGASRETSCVSSLD